MGRKDELDALATNARLLVDNSPSLFYCCGKRITISTSLPHHWPATVTVTSFSKSLSDAVPADTQFSAWLTPEKVLQLSAGLPGKPCGIKRLKQILGKRAKPAASPATETATTPSSSGSKWAREALKDRPNCGRSSCVLDVVVLGI